MNNFFDNQRILDLIWKRKLHFIVVGIIAIVLSAIFSGPTFIKPKFKSTARIYPTNNIAIFSEESETEQLLEIINSNDLKRKVFTSLKLDSVYKINKSNPLFDTEMFDKYNTNVSVSKTEYETVQIKVLDENPMIAKQICDSIIYFFNKKVGSLHSIKFWEVANITGKYIEEKSHELDSISERLQNLRNSSGIISYSSQVEGITEGYMLALAENNSRTTDAKTIKKQLDNLKNYGAEAYLLETKFERLIEVVDSLASVKEVALIDANKEITYSHVVEHPFAADKKAYPVRWLIVAFSAISAVFLALLVFIVVDYRKNE